MLGEFISYFLFVHGDDEEIRTAASHDNMQAN